MGVNLNILCSGILAFLLLIPAGLTAVGVSGSTSPLYGGGPNDPPAIIVITNNQSTPTPTPFQEMVVVDSAEYSSLENANLSNVWFSYSNGSRVPSWLQSGNSSSDQNSTYWLRINSSIPAGGSLTLFINFLPLGSIAFNNYSTGEAPQLSNPYGLYDDGSHVFNLYDNFSGTALKRSIWNTQGSASAYVVDNGISFVSSGTAIVSRSVFRPSTEVEAYGILNTPSTNDSTSYFLGGEGYGNHGMNCVQPVMTAGWAEAKSNMLGLSVWVGNGIAYTYNASKAVSPYQYHVFGTGYLDNGSVSLFIDNSLQNVTEKFFSQPEPSLNVTIGFQNGNFPKVNHFFWIFERNTTSSGYNLPFMAYTSQVEFFPSGLPAGVGWTLSIQGVGSFSSAGSGNIILDLVNRTYNATISAGKGYLAYPSGMSFHVDGIGQGFGVAFESPQNASLIRAQSTLFVPNPNGTGPSEVSGYYVSYSLLPFGFYFPYFVSMALDNLSNRLFATLSLSSSGNGSLVWDNLSSGTFGHLTLANYTNQLGLYYDPSNGYLYVPYNHGLLILDASTFKVVKTVSIIHMTVFAMSVNTGSNTFYLFSSNSTSKTNITTVSQTGEVLGNLSFPAFRYTSRQLDGAFSAPLYFQGNLIVSNSTGIMTYNLSAGTQTFVDAPSGYVPATLLPFGPPGSFLVGDSNINFGVSDIYNASSRTFSRGPPIPGEILASAYNSFSGDYYLWSLEPNAHGGNITELNPRNDSIVAVSPAPLMPVSSMIFEPSTQSLFVMDDEGASVSALPGVYVYSLQHQYQISFTESGLSSGAPWYVNISGLPSSGAIYGKTYSTYLPNGTYAYSVSSADKRYSPSTYAAKFTVAGGNVLLNESFSLVAYSVTFTETGLPSGYWHLTLAGTVRSAISGSSITLSEPNGSYTVSVGTNNSLYHPYFYSLNFTVNGASLRISVSFVATTYNLTFLELGLPHGTNWTITINNVSHTLNGTFFVMNLQNGTYRYSVSAKGYLASNQSGTVNVSGANLVIRESFKQVSIRNPIIYYEIGGIISVIAVAGISLFIWMRRKVVKK